MDLGVFFSFGFPADRCAGPNRWRLHHVGAEEQRPPVPMGAGQHPHGSAVLTLGDPLQFPADVADSERTTAAIGELMEQNLFFTVSVGTSQY